MGWAWRLQKRWIDKRKTDRERSAVGIPVVASDQVVGALVLSRPKEEQFTIEELERLKDIAES